ncbi:hypothetical protein C8J57DRAFT_1679730 [Mycena rebaudengoi]|nr:hypothetical protein C8J57DRAFT_1679730 [Mycena rebaudengoi]
MFHGRRNILDNMHAYFSQDIGRRHVCLLHGLGGAGKTQICLKFLDETDKSRFMDVFFLDASTIDTIKAGLKNIALTQSIGSNDEDASRWLASSQEEWLLIFDNADDPSIKLFNYFSQSSSGNILITSRNPQLALYCFPLAIVQAGAYIAKTQKLRKYLTVYEQNRAELLSRLPDQPIDKYAWSVYTTWNISFKCLGQLAAKFLQICSFLDHEGISETIFPMLPHTSEQIREPLEFLNNFLTPAGTWDELHFTDMTMEIQGYSLINEDPNTNILSIHPLVHDWSRRTITDTNSTEQCSATILAMATMSTWDDQSFHINLLPHLNSVLCGKPKIAHKFCYPYAWVYYDSRYFNQSKELCVALLGNIEHILGSEHPETLHVMSSLAATYWKLGKFTDSLELDVTVLQKRKQILGPEHPKTLAAMSNLAITYHELGKLAEAEELKVVVLEKRKQILGQEHPETLAAMSNLAITYWKLGKFTDAEELQVAVLEMRKKLCGTEHPETLTAMSNLAGTYHDLGKLTESEELKVMVLDKQKQILGPDHPDTLHAMSELAILGPDHPKTLGAMSGLAATYWKLGKFMDAEELGVAVLEKRKQLWGSTSGNSDFYGQVGSNLQ